MTIGYMAKKLGLNIKWAFWVIALAFLAGFLFRGVAHAGVVVRFTDKQDELLFERACGELTEINNNWITLYDCKDNNSASGKSQIVKLNSQSVKYLRNY